MHFKANKSRGSSAELKWTCSWSADIIGKKADTNSADIDLSFHKFGKFSRY
jgi:hypothetical protein